MALQWGHVVLLIITLASRTASGTLPRLAEHYISPPEILVVFLSFIVQMARVVALW